MSVAPNPYNWNKHTAKVEVRRPQMDAVLAALEHGAGVLVLGGRGMGKSILLDQVRQALKTDPQTQTALIANPPASLDADRMHAELAAKLGREPNPRYDSLSLLEEILQADAAPRRLVLLYDEFERYARRNGKDAPGRHFFNHLEVARRGLDGLGIVAAGSLGVFLFRDVLGSSFLSRADRVVLTAFERDALGTLTEPFRERGEPLADDTCEALWLASGGNPALITYGLQELWTRPPERRAEAEVAHIYAEFQLHHGDFLQDMERSFADPKLSDIPRKVWDMVQRADGPVPLERLAPIVGERREPLHLDAVDVVHMLQGAGLVRLDDSHRAGPVRPLPSLLGFPQSAPQAPDLADELVEHLAVLLERMHASSVDFYRPGRDGARGDLVPEAVFTAYLALGLQFLSWTVEREAQSVTGRTDLKLRREDRAGQAIVEVKLWGRKGYREAQRQVERYWSGDTAAAAVVMLADASLSDWPEAYRTDCLAERASTVLPPRPPLAGLLQSTGTTPDGLSASVTHLLLRLPRRG